MKNSSKIIKEISKEFPIIKNIQNLKETVWINQHKKNK